MQSIFPSEFQALKKLLAIITDLKLKHLLSFLIISSAFLPTHFTAKQEKCIAVHQVALEVYAILVKPLLALAAAQHLILPLAVFPAVAVGAFLVLPVIRVPLQ
jgi:hypothetical protein